MLNPVHKRLFKLLKLAENALVPMGENRTVRPQGTCRKVSHYSKFWDYCCELGVHFPLWGGLELEKISVGGEPRTGENQHGRGGV